MWGFFIKKGNKNLEIQNVSVILLSNISKMPTKSKETRTFSHAIKTEVVISSQVVSFASLGKELKISPKSRVSLNKSDLKIEYHVPTIELLIGIGKDHTARLIMSLEAWNIFKNHGMSIVEIDTLKQFRENLK